MQSFELSTNYKDDDVGNVINGFSAFIMYSFATAKSYALYFFTLKYILANKMFVVYNNIYKFWNFPESL